MCFGLCLTLLYLISPNMAVGQELIELDQYCQFDGGEIEDQLYAFDSDRDAEAALEKVMRYTGLEPNFIIKAANVDNASAGLRGQYRVILYNQQFMLDVKNATGSDWSGISILAHEIGHHLQGHTLERTGSRPPIELEADKYSGFILQKMGASLDDAQAAMSLIASESGSATHPGRQARLAAITNGWISARDLTNPNPDGDPPAKEPSPQDREVNLPSPNDNPPVVVPTYVSRAVFAGDVNSYYVTSSNDIVMIDPNGYTTLVGKKIAPTVPGFVWMYSTPYITYGVTADGSIWGRNQYGQSYKIGYLTQP